MSWTGPYSLSRPGRGGLLTSVESLAAGIYIWTIRVRGVHWTYYVGETGKSFLERHLEHIGLYYEGHNRIYDARNLALGRKRILWDWAMGSSNRPARAAFRSRFDHWAPTVQRFLAVLNVFLIPFYAEKRARERLEAGLWRMINVNGGGRLQEEGIRFRPCREGEPPLAFRFKGPPPVRGMQDQTRVVLPVAEVAARTPI